MVDKNVGVSEISFSEKCGKVHLPTPTYVKGLCYIFCSEFIYKKIKSPEGFKTNKDLLSEMNQSTLAGDNKCYLIFLILPVSIALHYLHSTSWMFCIYHIIKLNTI